MSWYPYLIYVHMKGSVWTTHTLLLPRAWISKMRCNPTYLTPLWPLSNRHKIVQRASLVWSEEMWTHYTKCCRNSIGCPWKGGLFTKSWFWHIRFCMAYLPLPKCRSTSHNTSRNLRSASLPPQLQVPRKSKTVGSQAFAVAAPYQWNALRLIWDSLSPLVCSNETWKLTWFDSPSCLI